MREEGHLLKEMSVMEGLALPVEKSAALLVVIGNTGAI